MEYKNDRKYAIYSRKSKFTGKGESIENQIELCKNHIRLHHPEITDNDIIVYEDEGFSGGNTNRPQFKKMMKDVKSKKIKSVVCYRLDRISRNVGDFAKLKDEFDYYDVEFVSIRDDFDTSTPSGRAMMMMVSVFAQLERETTAERIRDNMHELAKTGRWLGGITPTGYKSQKIVQSVTIDGKERTAYKLDIVESESEIIRVIFKKFLETNSLTKTDSYLLVNHIMTKNGREFSRYTIKGILQNPVYMCADEEAWTFFNEQNVEIYSDKSDFDGKHGVIAYNKTNQKPGRATRLNEMSEWIVSVGKHKPIISSHDWIMAQNNLWQNKSKSFHKPKSNVALLSGLLRCANCGDFMRPKLTGRTTKNGDRLYVYMCQTKERSRRKLCGIKDLYGNDLDELVCNKIKEIAESQAGKDERLLEITNYIYANYKDVTLDDLSEKFFLSKPYLSKYIKEKSGMTFGDILKKIRMKKARAMLKGSSATVESIAESVGYQNVEHFNRVFKKMYNITPVQYRNRK